MFRDDTTFNYWQLDVSNVINMSHMFAHSPSFNKDIGCWDVSNVLRWIECSVALHHSTKTSEIGMSNVTSMYSMFENTDILIKILAMIQARD